MSTAQQKTRTAQQKKDEAAIRDLIEKWSRAVEAKDPKAIVAAYTPETVLYDAIPPHRTVGAAAIAALWAQCFPYFPEKFRSEHKGLEIEVSGDVAFVHGLHHFLPEPADHPCGWTWMRVTACYKRINGQWRVAHEHVSIPFDPMTSKASFITDAGDVAPAAACGAEAQPASPDAQTRVGPVTPHLVCNGAAEAIEFYKKAFGATEMMRLDAPNGKLMHACLNINGSSVMLADEFSEMCVSPSTLKGTPVTIHLSVGNADAVAEQAVAAGAKVILPVQDMFWGDRYGVIEDPFGHRWSLGTPKQSLTVEEIQSAAKTAMCAA
jgi:PhnB protein